MFYFQLLKSVISSKISASITEQETVVCNSNYYFYIFPENSPEMEILRLETILFQRVCYSLVQQHVVLIEIRL